MSKRMRDSRLIGALFLLAILCYGVGLSLVMSVTSAPGWLAAISIHQTTLALGAVLMLVNSVVVVCIAVLFFPIVERHSQRVALAYLAARTGEAVLLAVGVLALLLLIPVSLQRIGAGAASANSLDALGSLVLQANTLAYQVSVLALALGSVALCALLLRSRLIPRFLAVWGVLGYTIFLAGGIAELVGLHIGVLLSIPGGLFEVAVAGWLLIRGFQSEAYG